MHAHIEWGMSTQDTTSILTRLRESGLSQCEISRRTGIPQPRLSRWSAGQYPEGANDILVLAALADEVSPLPPGAEATPC
jgi:transcriptional regulator with XRE-family HTH domain